MARYTNVQCAIFCPVVLGSCLCSEVANYCTPSRAFVGSHSCLPQEINVSVNVGVLDSMRYAFDAQGLVVVSSSIFACPHSGSVCKDRNADPKQQGSVTRCREVSQHLIVEHSPFTSLLHKWLRRHVHRERLHENDQRTVTARHNPTHQL